MTGRGKVGLTKATVNIQHTKHPIWPFIYNFSLTDLVDFTDEEGYGKYLDLHESYIKYINLKGIEVK